MVGAYVKKRKKMIASQASVTPARGRENKTTFATGKKSLRRVGGGAGGEEETG